MNEHSQPSVERRRELLAGRALGVLASDEEAELRALDAQLGSDDQETFALELAAASAAIALHVDLLEPMPVKVRNRAVAASAYLTPAPTVQMRWGDRRVSPAVLVAAAGWAAAAVLLFGFWMNRLPRDYVAERTRLMKEARDVTVAQLKGVPDGLAGLRGDVVWSEEKQQGYIKFQGLWPNDPKKKQYQLWIFDAERDERYPVDGGVFDVSRGFADEVVLPIRATLPVKRLLQFAITEEQPGGAVVSDRKNIVALAKPEQK
jgi:hypothetical protein